MGHLSRTGLVRAWLAAVYLLPGTPSITFAQDTGGGIESTLPGLPPATLEEPRPEVQMGSLRLYVFGSDTQLPLAGVTVQVGSFSPVTTDENGALAQGLPVGEYPISLSLRDTTGGTRSTKLEAIPIVQGESTLIIITLTPQATVEALDVESPAGVPRTHFGPTPGADEQTVARGTVEGSVRSIESREPVKGARIFVRGRVVETQTDAEGKFRIELPEGEHTLSLIHTDFSTQTLDSVQVRGGEITTLQVELTPAAQELEEFVVTAPHIQGSVASLLDTRREQAAASDSIGAEDIARTPAGDAAGAAQRVVGVNIVGGRFVYIRGLGERYTNALLNGLPLPSPEPDRATVPLDLFPTRIIKSIDVAKTFTPDMPGDFAGGSVRIETVGVPDKLVLAGSLSTGFNSQSTFRNGPSYAGGKWDWLGFDDGTRELPGAVPKDYVLVLGGAKPNGDLVFPDEIQRVGRAFNKPITITDDRIQPDVGASLTVGDGWKLKGGHRIGMIGATTYSRKVRLIPNEQHRVFLPGGEGPLPLWSRSQQDTTTEQVRWSAFAIVTYEFLRDQRIRFLGFRSQLADDEAVVIQGYSDNTDSDFSNLHREFAARALNLAQLIGEHPIKKLGNAKLDWRVALSNAQRDQPNTQDAVWTRADGRGWNYNRGPQSGRHFFSDQSEQARTAALDWTQPFEGWNLEHKAKVGGMLVRKDRDFRARRFSLRGSGFNCGPVFDPVRCPELVYTNENLESGDLELNEDTLNSDGYQAALDVYAGYGMLDIGIVKPLRLVAGARVEATHQEVAQFKVLTDTVIPDTKVTLNSVDVLPSASLIWTVTEKMAIRASGTRTLARPQLREIAPFAFANYFGGGIVSGNTRLGLTRIMNGDLRFEYFPTAREVLAASFFVKSFEDPIEPVLIPTGGVPTTTFQNAKGGFLYGGELEARVGLDFMADALRDFTFVGNLTLTTSQISVNQTGTDASGNVSFLTNANRPMVNQAPYVINLMLDYEARTGTQLRLLYNVSGPQLVQIGTQGLDDAYLHPIHSLDFTASQQIWDGLVLKLTLQNLINAEYLVTQGKEYNEDRVVTRYRQGITGSISVGYSY